MQHIFRITFVMFSLALMASPAFAEKMVFKKGGDSAKVQMSQESQWMLEASGKFAEGDYQGAEALYSRVIAAGGADAEAYLHRGLVRREVKNTVGMTADANAAMQILNRELQQKGDSDALYYQRSLANRLLKNFDDAESDLRRAMQLKNRAKYDTDMKAIALERKMAQ